MTPGRTGDFPSSWVCPKYEAEMRFLGDLRPSICLTPYRMEPRNWMVGNLTTPEENQSCQKYCHNGQLDPNVNKFCCADVQCCFDHRRVSEGPVPLIKRVFFL